MTPRLIPLGVLLAITAIASWALPRVLAPVDPHALALELIEAGRAAEAVHLLEQPDWRGFAEYRAGRYLRALGHFAGAETPLRLYNRGNAFARLHDWDEAIQAYERVLRLDPGNADARHNLAVVRRASEAEKRLAEDPSVERPAGLGAPPEGNASAPSKPEDESVRREGDGDGRHATASDRRSASSGPSDAAGDPGDKAMSDGRFGGASTAEAADEKAAKGLGGTSGAVVFEEGRHDAEILLRAIRDDPARVLAARLAHVHARREGSE